MVIHHEANRETSSNAVARPRAKLTFAIALFAAALPTLASSAEHWTIDPAHSSSSFAVRHLVISTVRGQFTKTTGKISLDPADLSRSSVEATIDATSIDTREPKRDAHLKSPDFFNVAKYPTLTFKSTHLTPAGQDKFSVDGLLTLHGVTKPVTLDVSASPEVKGMGGELRRGFTASTRIDRRDFGLTWNMMIEAGPAVGNEVSITLDIEAIKDVPPKK